MLSTSRAQNFALQPSTLLSAIQSDLQNGQLIYADLDFWLTLLPFFRVQA